METKQPRRIEDFWQQWKDLSRHDHPVKVKHLRASQIAAGRLEALDEKLPGFVQYKDGRAVFSHKRVRDSLASLRVRWKQRKERAPLELAVAFVRDNFRAGAEFRIQVKNERDTENPLITWYAYLYDKFASQYGWSLDQFNELPVTSINEFLLAMSARRAADSSRSAAESSPTTEGIKDLTQYEIRNPDIPRELAIQLDLEQWDAELERRYPSKKKAPEGANGDRVSEG